MKARREKLARSKLIGIAACVATATLTAHAFADDATLFARNCGACHGKAGLGIPGMAPPLAGADWAKAGKPESRNYVPEVVLNGLSGKLAAGGRIYQGVMPPQKQRSDDEIAVLVNFVLATLNGAPSGFKPLTAAEIESLRATTVDHKTLLGTRAQLVR
ncbi:MAG TPA: cytochrome c [Rhizobiaceae bacterium]|nr:cytochrome c [Rhizobiaceae bacterium]